MKRSAVLLTFFFLLLPFHRVDAQDREVIEGVIYGCRKCYKTFDQGLECPIEGSRLRRFDLRPSCVECDAEYPLKAKFCPWHGTPIERAKFMADPSKACALTLKAVGRASLAYAKKHGSFPWVEDDHRGRRAFRLLVKQKFFSKKDIVFSLGEALNSLAGFLSKIDLPVKEPQPLAWHTKKHATGERHVLFSDGSVKKVADADFQEAVLNAKIRGLYQKIDRRPYCKSCSRRCPDDANFCPEHGTALERVDLESAFQAQFTDVHEKRIVVLLESLARNQWAAWEKADSERFLSLKELAEARKDKELVKGEKFGYRFFGHISKKNPKSVFYFSASPINQNAEKDKPHFFVGPNGQAKRLSKTPIVNPEKGTLKRN